MLPSIRLVSEAKRHQSVSELCHKYLQTMLQLSEAETHTLEQYVLDTACDPERGACGSATFDSLEIAWVVAALNNTQVDAKETEPWSEDMIRPDRFARTYPQDLHENEKHAVCQWLQGTNDDKGHKMAQFFVWKRYLHSFLRLNDQCPQLLDASDPSIPLLRQRLREELKQPSHGDAMTTIARQLLRGCFASVASENQFRRRFPAKRNGMSMSDVLEADLQHPDARVQLNRQTALHPSKEGQWEQMIPRVQENWLLSMFIHRFNQDSPMTAHPLSFRDHYLLHWNDIGTPAGDAKLRCKTLLGHQRARPLVVHLGDEAWCLYERQTQETMCPTRDVVRVLAAWLYVVQTKYEGLLENGTEAPLFQLYFSRSMDATPSQGTSLEASSSSSESF